MAALVVGDSWKLWSVKQDELGHRDYEISFLVYSDTDDGPYTALGATGLPTYGSFWNFGSDTDDWAYCKLVINVKQTTVTGEQGNFWDVTCEFTTRPDLQKCQVTPFTDPILQCPKISGHSSRRTIEATMDLNGNPIVNSAYEQIRGPNNEWDASRTGVRIEMNVSIWGYVQAFLDALDYVNYDTMWGFLPRAIKLSNVTWEKKYWGGGSSQSSPYCAIYYTITLDFDIATFQPGLTEVYPVPPGYPAPGPWDRLVQDQGTKVLRGHYNRVTGQYIIDPVGGILTPQPISNYAQGEGGVLADGTYWYKVTAVDINGNETNASTPNSFTVTGGGGTASIVITIDIVPGATSYNIYGRPNTMGGTYGLIGSTETGFPAFLDDGTEAPGVAPPSTNMTLIYPSTSNPQNFIQYRDIDQNVCTVLLNGAGLPSDVQTHMSGGPGSGTIYGPGHILIQYYPEVDFLSLCPNFPTDITTYCTFLP